MDLNKKDLIRFNSNLMGKNIVPQSDLTNTFFDGQKLSGLDATQSLFNGSFFRETKVVECNFSRCDFEGVQFELVIFESISFKSGDIRSCKFVQTQFIDCDFSDTFIKNCVFIKCNLVRCKLNGSAFTESEIKSSIFENCSLTKSTNMLNKFIQCYFKNMKLGDCTFLLHVLDECQYEDVTLNSDSIGLIYGISEADLERCDLLFLGKEQPPITENDSIAKIVVDEYDRRKWLLHCAVSKLNFRMYEPLNFIKDISFFLSKKIKTADIIIMDEALFINNIFTLLYDKEMLPYWGLQYFFSNFGHTLNTISKQDSINSSAGNQLLNMNYIHFFNLQSRSKQIFSLSDQTDLGEAVVCKLKMKIPPTIDICSLMDDASFALTKKETKSEIIKTQEGSILYWISTTVGAIFGLKLILFGLNGCIIQLTELFSRVKVLSSGQTEEYKIMALSPEQRIPNDIAIALNSVYSKLLQQNILNSNDLNGLKTDNFISVETAEGKKQ